MKITVIPWKEPNRANTPPLHIASRGERFSTLTGLWWIDKFRFVVNHRNGLRLALFDIRVEGPIAVTPIPHLTDDIAAKQLDEKTWEVVVSGCWDAVYSIFHLVISNTVSFQLISTRKHNEKTFCHGVSYNSSGDICLAFHTGEKPRIEIADQAWKLPEPWGARDLCHDNLNDKYYAVAVSKNPQLLAYNQTNTSIWTYESNLNNWQLIMSIDGVVSDACQVYKARIWFPDQKGDRILGICLNNNRSPLFINGEFLDFPHGLGISENGTLGITNYGTSDIVLIDISKL